MEQILYLNLVKSILKACKLRRLEDLNYLTFGRDRFELNSNFASKGKVILFNHINKVKVMKKLIFL